ncbi:MAG: 5'/3'-nucleotidase SurE [Muribaculaceae bacterium]|nr:5'/3'-nucleotidase SurE [Muribaculaceae bacterium]
MSLILVSNDDGINANGVHALIDTLLPFGEVFCVCPDAPRSGQSMAITVNGPLRATYLPDYHGAKMIKVDGTPVDCIKLSMHNLLPRRPDLIVSGINHGSNASINILYSGTMGAAMEGCAFGVPSIGFSLTDYSPDADFSVCLPFVKKIVEWTLRNGLPEGICLNVNIPDRPSLPEECRVVRACRGNWDDEYKVYTDPHGGKFYWLTGSFVNEEPESTDTDEYCLSHGIASVVPTLLDRTAPIPAIPNIGQLNGKIH